MIATTGFTRAKNQIEARSRNRVAATRSWIGIDFSGEEGPRRAKRLVPLLVVALIAALGVAALRIELIRTRYAVAAVMDEETALIEEHRSLIIRRRQLRDPVELAKKARTRGFRPVAVALSLPDPGMTGAADRHASADLPSVAAAPPTVGGQSDWQ